MHRLTSIFLAGLLSAGLAGCTEDLTTPGSCPQTCPGGIAQLLDTVIYAVPNGDSSFVGYQDAGGGSALLVSAEPAGGIPLGHPLGRRQARCWWTTRSAPIRSTRWRW
jgi:hypothetical protein